MRPEGRYVWAAWSTMLVVAALASPRGFAQPAPEERDLRNLHFAFANYLGSGIYSVEGRTVQVYHFPITFDLRVPEGRRWGVRLRLPPMVGIYDLEREDVVLGGFANRMATVGFVPRLALARKIGPHWTVSPFVDLGGAKDLDGGDWVSVYGGGIEVDALYPRARYDLLALVRFVAAHHTGHVNVFGDDLVKVEPGVEARFPLRLDVRGRQTDIGVFAKHYAYFNELEIHDPEEMPVDLTAQWEVGVTVGTRTPLRVLRIPLPRLGLSFRFGEDLRAFRFVFGSPL